MHQIKHLTSAIVLSIFFATTVAAAEGEAISLDGAYVLDVKASDNIKAAVDVAVADVTFLWRGFARKDAIEMHPAYPRIQITHNTASVVVTFANDSPSQLTADGSPMQMPMDGTAAQWTRKDGDVLTGNAEWRNATLLQTIKKEGTWQRDNDFSLNADGSLLTLKVNFVNKHLSKPVAYRLVYRREAK